MRDTASKTKVGKGLRLLDIKHKKIKAGCSGTQEDQKFKVSLGHMRGQDASKKPINTQRKSSVSERSIFVLFVSIMFGHIFLWKILNFNL